MESLTVTLVVWLSFANPNYARGFHEARTPGLTEEACKAAAKLVRIPQGTAHCVVEGRPEPVWSSPPRTSPTRECASCGMDPTPGRRLA
jgi:hypothetical protein